MGGFFVIVGTLALLIGVVALVLGLVLSLLRRPVRRWMRWKPALGIAVLGLVVVGVGGALLPPTQQAAEAQQVSPPAVDPTPQPEAASEFTPPAVEEAEAPVQEEVASPYIKVTATPTGPFTVGASVTTNLPDDAVLSASLGLADQASNDTFIGTDFQKVTIKGGKASFTIDGTTRVFPANSKLPAGAYDVDVSFQPLWPENRSLAAKLGVAETVTGSVRVKLAGSGESAGSAQQKADLSKWVMLNVNMGDKWDETYYTEKLGSYQELSLENGNPEILKVYYFPKVDMTFIVNVYKGEISVWRDGKAHR